MFVRQDFEKAKTREELTAIAHKKGISLGKVLRNQRYTEELVDLQIELVHLQRWVEKEKMRVAVIFEGIH